jgi:hypothetical protein
MKGRCFSPQILSGAQRFQKWSIFTLSGSTTALMTYKVEHIESFEFGAS